MGIVRIGVFGGTFNPIHFGHLHIARNLQGLFSLSQIHFVVATMPPHKSLEDLIPFAHRYAMVSLAVAGAPSFIPSLIELEPQASPFSVDTMHKLSRSLRRDRHILYFIAGSDSLLEVKSWRESERLLTAYNFVFVMRPGSASADPGEILPEKAVAGVRDLTGLRQAQMRRRIAEESADGSRIYLVDIAAPNISATQIRQLTSSGKSIHRLVPGPVREYIRKLHLYGE